MWNRFSEHARRVVFFAQEEAGRWGESYVSTEHILIGLVREDDCMAARILDRIGARLERVCSEIEPLMERGDGRLGQDMQLSPRAKRIIDLAYDESRRLNNDYIGTEHLLLGLIREEEALAGRVLKGFGIDLERTRSEVISLQDAYPQNHGLSFDKVTIGAGASFGGPEIGNLGTLVSCHADRTDVEVAVDPAALVLLAAAIRSKDAYGYRELREAGSFFRAAVGTQIKRLQSVSHEMPRETASALLVRLLDGEFAGRKGWIAREEFAWTGPDENPFPPEDVLSGGSGDA